MLLVPARSQLTRAFQTECYWDSRISYLPEAGRGSVGDQVSAPRREELSAPNRPHRTGESPLAPVLSDKDALGGMQVSENILLLGFSVNSGLYLATVR
jgi:hypothetical protein